MFFWPSFFLIFSKVLAITGATATKGFSGGFSFSFTVSVFFPPDFNFAKKAKGNIIEGSNIVKQIYGP
jgi:hypothetical protein